MPELNLLCGVHSELVRAAGLNPDVRPYSVQAHLVKIEELIMKELETPTKPETTTDDDIPF